MEQFKARNLSMLMDLYSMTMSNGYYLENTADNLVAFDVFYRRNPDGGGFAIFAGLEQVLDFLEDFHFTQDDIDYFKSLNLYNDEFLDSLINYRFRGTIMAMPEGRAGFDRNCSFNGCSINRNRNLGSNKPSVINRDQNPKNYTVSPRSSRV
ncbi:hypothetical protein [uncultured Succinatimonas sp.]|uniref:hypothetical protein n=1 Tax=uncultured Succinatimonas sp. TaxID=1262973 RepID=UPI0027D955A1|nr:hypothetical protein [uncultured Succinatimonas sp.]